MPAPPTEEPAADRRESNALQRVRSPRYAWILAFLLLGLFVAIGLILAFVPWQQTAFGTGQVVAYAPLERQQVIEAPFEGRVVNWHVQEGSRVAPGDRIATVRDLDPKILERLEQERQAVENRWRAAIDRADRLQDRVTDLESARTSAVAAARFKTRAAEDRVEAARQKLHAAEARLVTAAQQMTRQRLLAEKGLTSTRSVEVAELEYEQAKAAVEQAQASLAAAEERVKIERAGQERLSAKLTAGIEKAGAALESARADVAKSRAALTKVEGRLARQRSQHVNAPRAGVILRLAAAEGTEIVKSGDELAILVPEPQTKAVELWMDGTDAPLLRHGQETRVQFEGWPALQIAGWPSLAVGTFEGRIELIDVAANDNGRIRVLVVPQAGESWPAEAFLRQGILARGWILLNRVSIGWELWRQFNGFPPGVQAKSPFLEESEVLKLRKRKK